MLECGEAGMWHRVHVESEETPEEDVPSAQVSMAGALPAESGWLTLRSSWENRGGNADVSWLN